MAFTVNGIGTTMCAGRGLISWVPGSWSAKTGSHDYDGCLCICVVFMPIVPMNSMHVYNRVAQGTGEQFQQIPIRWSIALIARAFCHRWLWALGIGGLATLAIALFEKRHRGDETIALAALGIGLILIAAGIYWFLAVSDRRNVNLRRVMMGTPFGSSDPVTWTSSLLQTVYSPEKIFGVPTFLEAAERALDAREFGKAMLAARYGAALEDAHDGERLTDDILADPDVREALPIVHRDPNTWRQYFGKGTESMVAPMPPSVPALPPPLPGDEMDERIQTKATGFRSGDS